MNGVHDMGGMHGFGPMVHEENEPVFHEPWEGRVYAMNGSGVLRLYDNIDASRHGLEILPPAVYLASSYYERWLARLERRLVELGSITQEELDQRIAHYQEHPEAEVPRSQNPAFVERARRRFQRPEPLNHADGRPPGFKVGDPVHTKNEHPAGHTRLPRYARDKRGVIALYHGIQDFADTNAHDLGPQPQALYSVRFDGQELWGPSAEPGEYVHIDLWESYLEPAE